MAVSHFGSVNGAQFHPREERGLRFYKRSFLEFSGFFLTYQKSMYV